MITQGNPDSNPAFTAYLVVGVVAAVASAVTAVLIFRSRSQQLTPPVESVQEILDRCRDQVRDIEQHMSEVHQPVYMK